MKPLGSNGEKRLRLSKIHELQAYLREQGLTLIHTPDNIEVWLEGKLYGKFHMLNSVEKKYENWRNNNNKHGS